MTNPTDSPKGNAFFYGTLMAPAVLTRVLTSPVTTNAPPPSTRLSAPRPAILQRYRRHRVRGADYPAIVPVDTDAAEPGAQPACVRGVLVCGLTAADVWRLDRFEGSEYTREAVRVQVQTQAQTHDKEQDRRAGQEGAEGSAVEEIAAETYVWRGAREALEPREWDFAEFVRDRMWRWAPALQGESEGEYAELDEAVAALEGTAGDGGSEEKAERVDVGWSQADPTGGRGVNGPVEKVWEGQA